ncbi:MAG: 50S ribosomal protein L11 methyltransferase [Candidatus Limnocylindrales bacterium]
MVSARAFVRRHTRLQAVEGVNDIRLHLSDDVLVLWRAVQDATGDRDAPIPFWAFAWGGGLALASYLRDHPEVVAEKRVLDIASGSGLCAIAAMRTGAAEVTAIDIDPFAVAAVDINARANGQRIEVQLADLLDDDPPDVDVILAGDCWYEEGFGTRLTAWLLRASERGSDVLIGDPGRRYLDHGVVHELATYEVRSTTDLEDLGRTTASVYEMWNPAS